MAFGARSHTRIVAEAKSRFGAARWFDNRNPPDTYYVNVVRMELARWHALNGNHDQTLKWLKRINATSLPWSTLELDPVFDRFKTTPQYRQWASQRDALAKKNRDAIAEDLSIPLTDWAAIGHHT